jgi:hypothetical protein
MHRQPGGIATPNPDDSSLTKALHADNAERRLLHNEGSLFLAALPRYGEGIPATPNLGDGNSASETLAV